MSQWKTSSKLVLGTISAAMFSLGVSIVALACRTEPTQSADNTASSMGSPLAHPTTPSSSPQTLASNPVKASVPVVLASVAPSGPAPTPTTTTSSTSLSVKRFIVTSAVRDREPAALDGPLVAGSEPVFAFAELVNRESDDQKVTVTFERKGSSERVGFATLTVPARTPRYRTWANTRFIREPGTWEAVLASAEGTELSRTSFEVAAR